MLNEVVHTVLPLTRCSKIVPYQDGHFSKSFNIRSCIGKLIFLFFCGKNFIRLHLHYYRNFDMSLDIKEVSKVMKARLMQRNFGKPKNLNILFNSYLNILLKVYS